MAECIKMLYLCAILALCVPLSLAVVLFRLSSMFDKTIALIKDTQVIGGEPVAFLREKREQNAQLETLKRELAETKKRPVADVLRF